MKSASIISGKQILKNCTIALHQQISGLVEFDFLVYKSNGYVLSIEHCEIFYTYMSKSIYVCIRFYQNDLKRRHFYYDSFMNENRSIWTYNTKGTILIDCLLYIDLNLDKPCLFNKLQLYYFINYLYLKIINKKYFTLNNKITTNYNNIKKINMLRHYKMHLYINDIS
jgi:hypothetical protein